MFPTRQESLFTLLKTKIDDTKIVHLIMNTNPAGINLNFPDFNERYPITVARMPDAPSQNE